MNSKNTPTKNNPSQKIQITNEVQLVNAINTITKHTKLILNNDITLTDSLIIPGNKKVTLTSSNKNVFFRLNGASGQDTIIVQNGGTLTLDGIIVTHTSGNGRGIAVTNGGTLIMYSGEISGNSDTENSKHFLPGDPYSIGGGVFNMGTFEMSGGKISNNTSKNGYGGGVYNLGLFTMFGGEISNNIALATNQNLSYGGGVFNGAKFSMSGGKISNNTSIYGGGIYVTTGNRHADGTCDGSFSMSGGKISNNTAQYGGGVYYFMNTFKREGGEISRNTAPEGKDLYKKDW